MKKHLLVILLLAVMLAFPATASAQVPDPGDWVDDLTQDIQFAIDGLWYDILLLSAQLQWFLMKIIFLLGIIIDLVTDFIANQAFAPLITQSNNQFGIAVSLSFTIAMLVLGLSYLIAHFIRFNVVDFKSAFIWYVLVALFFQLGPELYLGMNSLRTDINTFFYATSLDSINNSGSPLAPLNSNLATDGTPMLPPCDNFGWINGSPSIGVGAGVDGLDIGMAYMLATSRDVLGQAPAVIGNCITPNPGSYENNLPFRWYFNDGYFDKTISPPTWPFIPDDDRERSLELAAEAQYRLVGAWPLLWLGIFEKIVYLLVTFAQGLSFVSFGAAAIFAFFKRTEVIAKSVVDLWIEIIITSVVIALGQALIVSLALAAAATQNPLASIGVGLLCAVLMFILMLAGSKLVWSALTRIFSAVSQATGGAITPPQQVATGAAIAGAGTVAAVATGGGALALAGAAMAGMSATGIGGQATGMAGSQLMMAGRMANMGGSRKMVAGSNNGTLQYASASNINNLSGVSPIDSFASATPNTTLVGGTNLNSTSPNTPPQPIPVAGYDPAERTTTSPAGRRTSTIQADFTPDPALTPQTTQQLLNQDSLRDASTTQAQIDADNVRDDAALRQTLNTSSDANSAPQTIDTTSLDQAGQALIAAANTLRNTSQQTAAPVAGQMAIRGSNQVGAVVADAIDMERDYRRKMGNPIMAGAGDTFGGRMAQAVGMQPIAGQAPISEAARFNTIGDQALRLGLNGADMVAITSQQQNASDGRSLAPEIQGALVKHVRSNTGSSQQQAQQDVNRLLNLTAAMPDEVTISGTIDANRLTQGEPNNDR